METATSAMITVSSTVNAPVEKVWQYWTEPGHITKWCQASEDWHAPYADNDLRNGGRFKTTMAAKDGSFSFDFEGVYDRIEDHKLIEYTMGDGRKVKITFDAQENSTSVTESFDPEQMNSREMQQAGWQTILDNFKRYTESTD